MEHTVDSPLISPQPPEGVRGYSRRPTLSSATNSDKTPDREAHTSLPMYIPRFERRVKLAMPVEGWR